VTLREDSPKAISSTAVNNQSSGSAVLTGVSGVAGSHRDSSDLRAIQRPQAKKLPAKNSALPPPPQREPSIGSSGPNEPPEPQAAYMASLVASKKDPPPLPPPRPHRHARSSSLDLNKFKMGATGGAQQAEVSYGLFTSNLLNLCILICVVLLPGSLQLCRGAYFVYVLLPSAMLS